MRRPAINAAAAAVAVSALLTFPALASQSGGDIFRQSNGADDRVSYTGTITTVVYGPSVAESTVVRVDHQAPNKWRMWYVAPADAYGRLIVSNETLTYQYEPKIATIFTDAWSQSSPDVAVELDTGKVLKNYSVTEGPVVDIAGRKATTLSLSSRYSGLLVARVWVDTLTSLVLQRETYHADGTIDTKSGFDDVRIGVDFPKELFDLTVPTGMHVEPGATFAKASKDVASLQTSLAFAVISPTYLPDGFALEKAALSGSSADQGVQLIYSDGLRDFSVFESASHALPDLPNHQDQDVGDNSGVTAELSGETVLSWNTDRMNVTMVGDLTAKELAKIGESVKP